MDRDLFAAAAPPYRPAAVVRSFNGFFRAANGVTSKPTVAARGVFMTGSGVSGAQLMAVEGDSGGEESFKRPPAGFTNGG